MTSKLAATGGAAAPPGKTETSADRGTDTPARRTGVRVAVAQIFGVLMLLVVAFGVASPDAFLSTDNIRSMAQNVAILAVLGVGATFVIVTAGIDLSIGSVLVFASVIAAKAMDFFGGQGGGAAIAGLVAAVVAGSAWGALNGVIIAYASVPPLIVTLGSMVAALGLTQVMTNGVDIRVANDVLVNSIGYGNIVGEVPLLSSIAVVVILFGCYLLHLTRFGKRTYAIGSNAEAARRAGIRVNLHLVKVYTLCGALAGLAGILSVSFFQTTTIAGQSSTALNVIAGVVIGGTSLFGGVGTVVGTVIGLGIPAVLQSGFVIVGVQPYWQQVVVGTVLVLAVAIDQRRRAKRSGRPLLPWRQRFRPRRS